MKAASAFLGILVIALAIALGMNHSEVERLKASAAVAEKATREKAESADEQIAALKSRVRSLEGQVASRASTDSAAEPGSAAPIATGKGQQKGKSNWAQASRAMMDNPEMREMMHAQQEAGLKVMYGQLLDSLDLTDEQRKQVLDELLAAQQAAMGSGMKLMDPSTSDEEKAALGKQIADATTKSKERLKEILGEEKYKTYEQYENSQPERMQLNTMRQRLVDAQIPLTGDQEQKLMDMMYRERVAAAGSTAPPPGSNGRWPTAGADEMLKQVELAEQRSNRIVESAGGILNQQQLDIFRTTQEDMLRMQRMGAEMMKQMSKDQSSK